MNAETSTHAQAADAAPAPSAKPNSPPADPFGLPTSVETEWGETRNDHYGYASEQERLAKRGMEDWELVTKIPASQRRVPYWFIAVVLIVLLIAIGLGFPFWGQRPGVHVAWFNWGFVAAIFYIGIAAYFVYYMTNLYGSEQAGRLDNDPEADPATKDQTKS